MVRCDAHESCSNDHGCSNHADCIKLNGCLYAICEDTLSICQQACGSQDCLVKDSSPLQMPSCPDGRPIRGG